MRKNTMSYSAVALTMFAGLSAGLAQATDPPDNPSASRSNIKDGVAQQKEAGSLVFVSGAAVRGMTVKNNEDETLGTIDDLIIDRGSGRIRYIVMKSGAVLGMGGKLVTVPYQSFGWSAADKHVTLSASPEEIKSWPEFNKSRWMEGARSDDSFIRTIGKDYYNAAQSPWPSDSQAGRDLTKIDGTINSISRRTVGGGHEELVVVVSSKGHPDQEVVLGPSWYMTGNNSIAFYRNAPVNIDVFGSTRDGSPVLIAKDATINGKTLTFYDSQGHARWAPNSSGTEGDSFAAAPFVLASEIEGKPVDCRGEKCGSVKDLVMECTSGHIVFLSIDPDKAYFGIGDTKRLVPWSVMTRSLDGHVHLDTDKATIKSGPVTPTDLKTLGANNDYKRIHAVYNTQPMPLNSAR